MPKDLPKSKFGEGIGGKTQIARNPNSPTSDPADKWGSTEKKIIWLLADERVANLNPWERSFLIDVYGKKSMTPAMHRKVSEIFKRHNLDSQVR